MQIKTSISTIYHCSMERAFKTPMLCAVEKVHTGLWIMPKITHSSDDKGWGQVGSSKKVYAAKSLTQKGGFASMDHVLERIENKYWKIKVDNFQAWMLGFTHFVGEWQTTPINEHSIKIDYTYTLYANTYLYYPFNWLFVKLFWRKYMRQVLHNIEDMIKNEEPYLYN